MKKLILALALPLALIACNKSSNTDPAQNVDQAAKETNLQAKIFRGDCSLKPLDSIATGLITVGASVIKSAREQYEFVGANLTHTTLLYNSACPVPYTWTGRSHTSGLPDFLLI